MPDWVLQRRRTTPHPTVDAMASFASDSGTVDALQPQGMRSLLRISEAVMRASYFDEVLEVIAEQTLVALDAASCSISRWERQHDAIRTLINVGELGPREERWPSDEIYYVTGDQPVTRLLQHGSPYLIAIDDDHVDPAEAAWLREIGKQCELAVPVMYGHVMWGELWVTGVGGRRFGSDDVQLLQGIAAYAAMAIGRSELFSRTWRFAHQDPLTGLANRRELERLFGETDWATVRPAVVVCDLDGFKDVNDRFGHAAGDELLRNVADILTSLATGFEGATAVRLGGDEFCVLLPRSTLSDAERFARHVSHGVRQSLGEDVTLSWGATVFGPTVRSGHELLATADTALLEAKRLGPGRFNVAAGPRVDGRVEDVPTARPTPGRRGVEPLLSRLVHLLDQRTGSLGVADALEMLAIEVHGTIDAAAWSIASSTDDGVSVRTIRGVHSVQDPVSGLATLVKIAPGNTYHLANYPATARAMVDGSAFVAAVDLDGSDPAEVALLRHLGYRAVLGVCVTAASRSYLLEIYSTNGHHDLTAIAPAVRVLAHYCANSSDDDRVDHA